MSGPQLMQARLPVDLVRRFVDDEPAGVDDLRAKLSSLLDDVPQYSHALFFGCIDRSGHYLWGANRAGSRRPLPLKYEGQQALLGTTPHTQPKDGPKKGIVPWGWHVDGGLMPKQRGLKQGEAVIAYKDGWTALSFWDRTVEVEMPQPVVRRRWVADAAPQFSADADGFLAQHVPEQAQLPWAVAA